MSNFLKLTTNSDELSADMATLAERINGVNYDVASEAMRDISMLLKGSVQDTMTGQAFVPLSPVTVEYKARKGLDPRILFATGSVFANLEAASGASWAATYRGREQWYAFLHDRGKGAAHWSKEGEARARGKAPRRHRGKADGRFPMAQLGLTRFPKRQMFVVTEGAEASILARYELFVQTALDEVGQ